MPGCWEWILNDEQTARSGLTMLSGACSAGELRSDRIVHRDACSCRSKRHILVGEKGLLKKAAEHEVGRDLVSG
jgi:hypothetical protein